MGWAHYVLTGFARQSNLLSAKGRISARGDLRAAAGWIGSVHDATALNETRTLSFHHTHSGEDLTVTFKREGRYDEEALKQLNHFLRDWRTQDQTTMDPHLFDIIWEVYRDVDGKKPIQIISAYRSPETNAMLRRRSAHTGVARFSQHMLGHAMDFYIPDVPLEQIRYAGLRLQRGGVGFYPTSGSPFVHLDTGNIRHWPRMTHDQLARVFPDGRTVHIPSDGTPLKGYELARADIERRGSGDDAAKVGKPRLLARLFGGKSKDDEDEGSAPAFRTRPLQPRRLPPPSRPTLPAPRTKAAAATLQLAAADTQTVQPAKPKQPAASDKSEAKPQTPADIINARGFWDDMPAAPNQATPAQVAALNARKALARPIRNRPPAFPPRTRRWPMRRKQSPRPITPMSSRQRAVPPQRAPGFGQPQFDGCERCHHRRRQEHRVRTAWSQPRHGSSRPRPNDNWMRIMMLAPSASTSMSVTMLGDANMTLLSKLFVKPQTAIVMGFSDDPLLA